MICKRGTGGNALKKRIVSLLLTCSLLLSVIPFQALSALAAEVAAGAVLYGDADGNGRVELLDVNLMERRMLCTLPKPTSTPAARWIR